MLVSIMALPSLALCTPIKRNSFPLSLLWFTRFGCNVLWMIQIEIIVTVIVVNVFSIMGVILFFIEWICSLFYKIWIWIKILKEVKDSRLILKSSLYVCEDVIKKKFEKEGLIDSIKILKKTKRDDFLTHLNT